MRICRSTTNLLSYTHPKNTTTKPITISPCRVFTEELWATVVCGSFFLAIIVWMSEKNFHDRGMGKCKYPLGVQAGLYEGAAGLWWH